MEELDDEGLKFAYVHCLGARDVANELCRHIDSEGLGIMLAGIVNSLEVIDEEFTRRSLAKPLSPSERSRTLN